MAISASGFDGTLHRKNVPYHKEQPLNMTWSIWDPYSFNPEDKYSVTESMCPQWTTPLDYHWQWPSIYCQGVVCLREEEQNQAHPCFTTLSIFQQIAWALESLSTIVRSFRGTWGIVKWYCIIWSQNPWTRIGTYSKCFVLSTVSVSCDWCKCGISSKQGNQTVAIHMRVKAI